MKTSTYCIVGVTVAIVLGVLALAAATPLTGSVPSTSATPGPNGNGSTGSIACQFTGLNRPVTKWWVDRATPPSSTWQYRVEAKPATSITGFDPIEHTVYFSTAAPNRTPSPKKVTVPVNKTIILNVEYK